MALSLTRTVSFRASHRIAQIDWSDEENRARFGWTSERPGHEHEYACSVTVSGPPDPMSGSVVDLAVLDRVLAEEITEPLQDRFLNEVVPPVAEGQALATCEVLAHWLYRRVAARLPTGLRLERVRVAEDSRLHADCTGPA